MADEDLARFRWRVRRGMRELDAVLTAFLERGFGELTPRDKRRFDALLDLSDPELHGYLFGRHEPADPELARLVHGIRRTFHD